MNKTKIEWCDSTWNPITGCRHKCEYCYARNIANRFGQFQSSNFCTSSDLKYEKTVIGIYERPKNPYPYLFTPTFHRYKLDDYKNKKGRTIFVCSMADMFGDWVPNEWIQEVFKACEAAPQHRYLFLTKNPKRYKEFERLYQNNMWFGMSYTHLIDGIIPGARDLLWLHNQNLFMSLEPILEPLHFEIKMLCYIDWVILGAETGNRKGKVIPKLEWIQNIVEQCQAANVPVFMKNNLAGIWSESLIQQYPWEK